MASYWEIRQANLMCDYMNDAEDVAAELADLYYKASRQLNFRIDQIYEKFRDKHHLTDKEAMRLLNSLKDKNSIEELKRVLANGPDNRKALLAELESPAYQARIQRLQQLQVETDLMMQYVYNQEKAITTSHYINLANKAYYHGIYDIQQMAGFQFPFAVADAEMISSVLNSSWKGSNYSERIWKNTQGLAIDIKEQLMLGLLTGKRQEEMARELANKFSTGAFNARRLVRTESNFIANEMHRRSMKECEIEYYTFSAILDLVTSKICRTLDLIRFKVKEAIVGKNMPPIHPFCRSIIIADITKPVLAKMERRARDPITGKTYLIPANISYAKWYEQNVANNPDALAEELKIKNKYKSKR